MLSVAVSAQNTWNNPGIAGVVLKAPEAGPPAPALRRTLQGIWDAGRDGIGARGQKPAPLTPWGEALGRTHHSGDGIRMVPVEQIDDPLSTMGDPAGFPRN